MAEQAETDVTAYLEKAPTSLQVRFASYLQEEVGYNPNAAKTKLEAFQEGVRLATALRMVFQASDYNRNGRAAEKAASGSDSKDNAPAPAKAAKAAKAAKTAPPAKAAKSTAPAKATRRRGAAAAVPVLDAETAPF